MTDSNHAMHEHPVHGVQEWDERYRSQPQIWSGEPNPVLVVEAAHLEPGTALDAGCGEGADALWLALQGWQVTGTDLSAVALDRAAQAGRRLGRQVTWRQADLVRDAVVGSYDLVTASYLHLPAAERSAVFAHLAAAVNPGGALLVVGHDFSDLDTTIPRPGLVESGWTAAEVADALDEGWTVEVADSRPRPATDPDGQPVTIHDVVVRARRADN